MIEDDAIEGFGRGGEPAGGEAIRTARRGIAARVIMREEDPGAAVQRGIGNDVAQGEGCAVPVAFMSRKMDAAGFLVDVRHPQAFA